MRREKNPRGRWQREGAFFLTAVLVAALDQLSKLWIRCNLAPGQSMPEEGLLRLTHVQNTGAAFGLFADHTFPLTIISLVGVAALLLYYLYPLGGGGLSMSALGLLLGGSVGNLIDRLRLGYATDFIDVGFWPVFNLADSAIVVGAFILAYSFLFKAKKGERPAG